MEMKTTSVKALSTILIVFIGLNLAATGLAVGLCTGQPDCMHCTINAPTHSNAMPAGHGCCETPTAAPCDVEINSVPQRPFIYLVTFKHTQTRPSSFDNATAGIVQVCDFNQKTRTSAAPAKIPIHKAPLYIQHLSLIC